MDNWVPEPGHCPYLTKDDPEAWGGHTAGSQLGLTFQALGPRACILHPYSLLPVGTVLGFPLWGDILAEEDMSEAHSGSV